MDEEELLLHYASGDISELKSMIRPEQVIAAVKSYIEDVSLEGAFGAAPGVGGKKLDEEQRIGQKRLNSMRGYWHQLCQVVSDDSVEVWRQLERDCVGLKELLARRAGGITDVDNLARRNVELKRLLNQYLGDSKVNNYMMVPPAHVMKVRDVSMAATASNYPHTNSNTYSMPERGGSKGGKGSETQGAKYRNSLKGSGHSRQPTGIGGTAVVGGGLRQADAYSKTH